MDYPLILEANLDELGLVAKAIKSHIPKDAIISLNGDLASGKTTLTKAIAKYLGLNSAVSSPTFSICHIYDDNFYHYDLYRKDFQELATMGVLEQFENSGWHIIEWASSELKEFLIEAGFEVWEVTITPKGSKRVYKIEPLNE